MTLSPGERLQHTEEFIGRRIAGETVLVPLRQQIGDLEALYTLNEVASFIWDRLDGRATVEDIAAALDAEFEAPPAEIRADLQSLLTHLLEIRAIRAVGGTGPTAPAPAP